MTQDDKQLDPVIVQALRDRLADLTIERDQAEMRMNVLDARIDEIRALIDQFSPTKGRRGRPRNSFAEPTVRVIEVPTMLDPEPPEAA